MKIPSDVRTRLKKDFERQGIAKPTDADLLGAFFDLQSRDAKSRGP